MAKHEPEFDVDTGATYGTHKSYAKGFILSCFNSDLLLFSEFWRIAADAIIHCGRCSSLDPTVCAIGIFLTFKHPFQSFLEFDEFSLCFSDGVDICVGYTLDHV